MISLTTERMIGDLMENNSLKIKCPCCDKEIKLEFTVSCGINEKIEDNKEILSKLNIEFG